MTTGQSLHETAARGFEAISQIVLERDQLLQGNARMQTDIVLLRQKVEQQEGRLAVALAERDHYMRFCAELTTKLNDIQMLIVTTIETAKYAAYRPAVTSPKAKPLSDIDASDIETLIKKLPINGGTT